MDSERKLTIACVYDDSDEEDDNNNNGDNNNYDEDEDFLGLDEESIDYERTKIVFRGPQTRSYEPEALPKPAEGPHQPKYTNDKPFDYEYTKIVLDTPQTRSGESISITIPHQPTTKAEISKSSNYFSVMLSTIQPLSDSHSLVILDVTCHSSRSSRFTYATVQLLFHPTAASESGSKTTLVNPSPSPSSKSPFLALAGPRIVMIAPVESEGGQTTVQTNVRRTVGLPVHFGTGPASIGVEISAEKETQKVQSHKISIKGSIRGIGDNHAFWDVTENKSSKSGIPLSLKLGVAVEHKGPFVMELTGEAELARGWRRAVMLRAKDQDGNDWKETIDVETWRHGEIEVGQEEQAWREHLRSMTGAKHFE
jgi:hypothetical protein